MPDYFESNIGNLPTSYLMGRALSNVKGMTSAMREQKAGQDITDAEAMLRAISCDPAARETANTIFDRDWQTASTRNIAYAATEYDPASLVIIGGGLHAAIAASTWMRITGQQPIVIERSSYVGGAFGLSRGRPAFYLNSENRPGAFGGTPAEGDSLNYMPGGVVQVADFCTREFPSNDEMSWAIRATLAMTARVYAGIEVIPGIEPEYRSNMVRLQIRYASDPDGIERSVYARRVLDVRGLGGNPSEPVIPGLPTMVSDRVMSFPQFLARVTSEPGLMQRMSRVAVIGGGDSAKVTIEALTGIGPNAVAGQSLTRNGVARIDWWARNVPTNRETFREQIRGRYLRIASYLPSSNNRDAYHDVTVYPRRGYVSPLIDGVMVESRTYDHAIVATGQTLPTLLEYGRDIVDLGEVRSLGAENSRRNGIALGRRYGRYYVAGPAAKLPFEDDEYAGNVPDIAQNSVSIFRLAARTSALVTRMAMESMSGGDAR